MDYNVFKPKVAKSEPEPTPPPAPPPASVPEPPSPPHQGPAHPQPGPGPIPFMGRGYMEELDRMSRIPGMRDFEVTYSKTYRWNMRDPMDDYQYHYRAHGQPMAYRGMQWVPTQPSRRPLGPPPEFGLPRMLLAPPHHAYDYDYPCSLPTFGGHHHGPYRGGGGYYGDQHSENCRVM